MILGKLIRRSVAAFGALAALSVTQANATDLYSGGGGGGGYKDIPVVQPPCCSFAGFYIGGNMGMAFSHFENRVGPFADPAGGVGTIPTTKFDSTNGFGGGQIGYNFQTGCCFVYGIEADLGALALGNGFHRFTPMNDAMVNSVALDGNRNNDAFFAGDITGRLGYAFGNSMLYAKGGYAFIDAKDGLAETIFFRDGTSATFGDSNKNRWLSGWTAGAGYEWKPCCQSSWSIKVEYLHYDFSHNSNDFFDMFGNRFRNHEDITAETVKIGFNYFWSPGPSLPLK
jgi:outer membrane immunogenic protein